MYCGLVTIAAGFCFKAGYSCCNRLISLFPVPYGMCQQTNCTQRVLPPTATNSRVIFCE